MPPAMSAFVDFFNVSPEGESAKRSDSRCERPTLLRTGVVHSYY